MGDQIDEVIQQKLGTAIEADFPELTPRAARLPAVAGKAQAIIGMRCGFVPRYRGAACGGECAGVTGSGSLAPEKSRRSLKRQPTLQRLQVDGNPGFQGNAAHVSELSGGQFFGANPPGLHPVRAEKER